MKILIQAQFLILFISANRIPTALSSVRQEDLKLMMTMDRTELKQGVGSEFAKPIERVFYCPRCSEDKLKVSLVQKMCPKCRYLKSWWFACFCDETFWIWFCLDKIQIWIMKINGILWFNGLAGCERKIRFGKLDEIGKLLKYERLRKPNFDWNSRNVYGSSSMVESWCIAILESMAW